FVGYTPLYSTAVWTGHPLSRAETGFGGPTSGPIWRSFMEAAQGGNCPDFAVPSSLPDLTAFHGDHTAAPGSSCFDSGSGTSTPSTSSSSSISCPSSSTTITTTTTTGGSGNGNNNKGAYAPGVGQKPAPQPKPKPTPAPAPAPAPPPPA